MHSSISFHPFLRARSPSARAALSVRPDRDVIAVRRDLADLALQAPWYGAQARARDGGRAARPDVAKPTRTTRTFYTRARAGQAGACVTNRPTRDVCYVMRRHICNADAHAREAAVPRRVERKTSAACGRSRECGAARLLRATSRAGPPRWPSAG